MTAAIISLIIALVSYFGSKKAGASDGQAAAIAGAAGLGSYYVSTQTEWGKNAISSIESWVGVKDAQGNPVNNGSGAPATVPKGAEVIKNADGTVAKDANGNVLWKMVDSTGKVLTSWGPTGTAAVIGTTAVATGKLDSKWLWAAGGIGAFLLLR